jgi:1-aminocyclopropane-1-carboxylate deaminase
LLLKRDDLIHPILSGNKWRKLHGLIHRLQSGQHLASMGGPWSNHLHALAWLCHQLSVRATFYVRGHGQDTDTLKDCRNWGADIVRVDRSHYRSLREQGPSSPADWWLPEGGTGPWNEEGGHSLIGELPEHDWLVLAVGSGGTLLSMAPHVPPATRVMAIAVGAGPDVLAHRLRPVLEGHGVSCCIEQWPEDPGFGKTPPAVLTLLETLWKQHDVLLDPVYTAKMWLAVSSAMERGMFLPGQQVILVHSGGLQGLRGIASAAPWASQAYRQWLRNRVSFVNDVNAMPDHAASLSQEGSVHP